MARLWSTGFELQTNTNGIEFQRTNGTTSINTSTFRKGTASLRCNPTAGVGDMASQVIVTSTGSEHVFLRAYIRVASYPTARTTVLAWADNNSTTSGHFGIRMNTDGTLIGGSSATTTGTASSALSLNTWYRLEVDYDDSANTLKCYLDGVNWTGTLTGMDLAGGAFLRVGVINTCTADMYFDDVAVNDASGSVQNGLPGPGYIVHMHPDSAGDNNNWAQGAGGTAGSANNWARVSETTPDDATTYNTTSVTGTATVDDFNMQTAASAGIGASDTINLVAVGARVGSNATTTANIVYRIKSQASGTVLEGNTVSCALNGWTTHDNVSWQYQLHSYTDPQAGGAWTPSLLNTAQIGYRNPVSQSTVRRVTTLWALVEFQDGSNNFTQTPADNVGVTDVAAKDVGRVNADTVGVTDTTTASVGLVRTATDSVGVTDSAVAGLVVNQTYADSVNVTDSVVIFKGVFQASDDTVGVTDGITVVQDYRPSVSDTAGLTDSVVGFYQGVRTFGDDEAITDTSIVSQGFGRAFTDSENVTDSSVVSQGFGRLPADTENLTDSISTLYNGIRTPADDENLTDSLAKVYGNIKADNVGITDSIVTEKTTLPVVPPSTRPLIGLVIKLFDPAPAALMGAGPMGAGGDVTSVCPDIKAVSWTDELSQSGTISIEYPTDGVNYGLLTADRAEGAVFWGEMEIPGTRFLVSEQARDPLDEQGGVVKINAPAFVGKRLEEAIVHPTRWPTPTPPQQTFTNVTPGAMLLTLISQAQGRSALGNLETDFTGLVDSKGVAWSQTVSMVVDVGDTYRSIVNKLVEMGVIDWRGDGRTLQMYNWGTLGSDLTGGATPVILYAGRDMLDAPENRSVLNLTNAVYSLGEDAWSSEVTDSTSIAQFGRIEGFISSSGVYNTGTLTVIGQAYLDKMKHAQQEYTHNLTFAEPTAPVPYTDYRVGDKILRAVNGTKDSFVVRQMTFSMDDNGDVKATITLNDKFYTQDVLLQRRMNALTGGSGSTSSSPADQTTDTVPPKAPTSVSAISNAYVGNAGVTYAAIQASWTEPTENTDDSTMTDLDYYEVQWKYSTDTNWTAAGTTGSNVLQWSGVLPGLNINIRVRAVDRNGNKSAWSTTATHLTASDSTAPPQPSTPVVSNYLGVLRVSWNGLTNGGGTQPADFAGAEVHVSTTNNFTPSSATKVDTLPAAGVSVISALPGGTALVYGTTYYVKLISVDRSGNASTPSSQGSGVPAQVVQTDIGQNVIDFSNIRFKDLDNLIPDGSFELATTAAIFAPIAFFEVNTTPALGTSPKSLFIDPPGAGVTVNQNLATNIPCKPTQQFIWIRSEVNTIDVNSTARLSLRVKRYYADGSSDDVEVQFYSQASNHNNWNVRDATYFTIPTNCFSMDLFVQVTDMSAGQFVLDEMEVRPVNPTALIQDAAISTAKIADLAVNNAKISDLSVAKVTAGTISADWIVGARIKTADTGARVELNSTGLKAYNSGGTNTVNFASSDGSAFIMGQLVSGTSGRRLEVNPTATYLPEIRMYPNTGSNYAYVNAVSSGDGTAVWFGANSGTFAHPDTGETSHNRLFMLDGDSGIYLECVRSSDGAQNGPRLRLAHDWISAEIKTTTDAAYLGFMHLGRTTAEFGIDRGGTTADGYVTITSAGVWDMKGRWYDYVGVASNAALFTGSVSPTSGTSSWATTFGPTMATQLLPICSIRDNITHEQAITDSTTSGFEVTISPAASGAYSVYFWCFRI